MRYEAKLSKFRLLFEEKDYVITKDESASMNLTYNTIIHFKCNKHPECSVQKTTYELLKYSNVGCKECTRERKGNAKRRDYSTIKKKFTDKGYDLLEVAYKNDKTKMKYVCLRHPDKIQLTNVGNLHYRKHNCIFCYSESVSKENSSNWSGGVTSEDALFRNSLHYKLWRKEVFSRDNYICQSCLKKGGSLNAHHIENYSSNPDKRTDINNGITLCEKCHSVNFEGSFHNTYGTWNNSKKQLIRFIEKKRMHLKLSKKLPDVLKLEIQ
ncbi:MULTISPECIES: HNH endonuclease [Paenibacillus]|uniref:HNH endonuclease n=1 Tax=Paenibacillus TaxID=44249 RepID=UPI000B889A65|nr:HNH endonuclease [Paenibacillus amylolyticus]